jgi:putative transposase
LLAADLSQLDLVAFMVDGVHFGEHTCVVALGIDIDGTKHPLSLVEGSTENATLVTELIVGLRERGLDVTRPILAVLDGSKALRRAVLDVFDRPVIGRCQLHKIRNVEDHLPEKLRTPVTSRMRRAYHADSALAAEAELCALAAELDRTHPGAAASLREGMAETLTVLRLGHPAHARAHPALDQRGGEHDLDLPHPRGQRQELARRADGAALVRRRNGRGRQAIPPRERPHAPALVARHTGEGHPARRCNPS